ncbi:MAG: P-II family nitrogen regulator [Thermaurantiacus sp.]
MQFSAVVGIFSEHIEDKVLETARSVGAHGVTILPAKGIGTRDRKTFFGLTYEGRQQVFLFIVERTLAKRLVDAFIRILDLDHYSKGLVFTARVEDVAGLDDAQRRRFEELQGGPDEEAA